MVELTAPRRRPGIPRRSCRRCAPRGSSSASARAGRWTASAWRSRPASRAGLVGANGAGKTTFIKCALDLCAADAGRVEIFGLDSRQAAARARLAYLPERFVPPHYLLGREFLAMTLALGRRALSNRRAPSRWPPNSNWTRRRWSGRCASFPRA